MLSRKTKYGLKALVYIGRQEPGRAVSTAEIAEAEHISRKFLESIMLLLRNNGILVSRKGKEGGYHLIGSAREITLAKVMRILEGPIAMVPCVSLNFYESCDDCMDEASCSVRKLMLQVRDHMLEVYQKTTLEDLL